MYNALLFPQRCRDSLYNDKGRLVVRRRMRRVVCIFSPILFSEHQQLCPTLACRLMKFSTTYELAVFRLCQEAWCIEIYDFIDLHFRFQEFALARHDFQPHQEHWSKFLWTISPPTNSRINYTRDTGCVCFGSHWLIFNLESRETFWASSVVRKAIAAGTASRKKALIQCVHFEI